MTCKACNTPIPQGSRTCPSCGKSTRLGGATMIVAGDQRLTIGRDAGCDIVLDIPVVSSRHAEIQLVAGHCQIRDLRSTNGTWVDGARVTDWSLIDRTTQLRFGSFRVPSGMIDAWTQRLGGEAPPIEAVQIEGAKVITIGRDPESTVCIEHPTVSWNHAQIELDGTTPVITDLRSTNGTFVNEERVRRAPLPPGAKVRVGSVPLDIAGGVVQAERKYRGEVRLDVREVTRKLASGRVILDEVSLSIFPGEMVALMGPSGAGKTTLLEVLTGQREPSSGSVQINDTDLHANRAKLAQMIGYVPQEDVMHRDLTVFEVLYHAARLRLPSDLPDRAIVLQVDALIQRIGLAHVRDTLIGGESVRGISGGQRKRVNIAIELITEPPLLFLDEPTSGLDATATLEVLQLLRTLAQDGRTIIMTIHQPRTEAFRLMDMLVLLEKGGKLAYFGPAVPDSAGYFEQHAPPPPPTANPADYVLDVLESTKTLSSGEPCPPGTWQGLFRGSEHYKTYVRARLADRGSVQIQPATGGPATRRGPGTLTQVRALIARNLRRKARDRAATIVQALQPAVVGGLLAWMFAGVTRWPFVVSGGDGKDKCAMSVVLQAQAAVEVHAILFLVGATAFWLGCSNIARELVAERAIFRRERMAGLSVGAYTTSVYVVQALIGAAQCLVLAGCIWLGDLALDSSLSVGFGTSFLSLLAGLSAGMVISATVASEVTAISALPLLLLPQLILGGYIEHYGNLSAPLRWLASLMPVRWAFEALLDAEYAAARPVCGVNAVFGFPNQPVGAPVVLAGIAAAGLILSYLRLRATKTTSP